MSEVRRAAVAEVQRAVGAAEARAQELVAAERAKVEALLREVGRRDPSEPRTEPQQVGFALFASLHCRWKDLIVSVSRIENVNGVAVGRAVGRLKINEQKYLPLCKL